MPEVSPTRFTMVPARRSSEPTARKRARRILGALFLAATLSVVAVFVAMAKGSARADNSAVEPQGRDLAYTAAVNHLAGTPQNVPRAASLDPNNTPEDTSALSDAKSVPLPYRSLSWTGFTRQHFGSEKAGYTDFEVHHFLVALVDLKDLPKNLAGPNKRQRQNSRTTGQEASGSPSNAPSQSPSPSESPSASPSDGADPPANGDAVAPASNMLQLDVTMLLTVNGPRLAAVPTFSVWTGGAGAAEGKGDYTNYSDLNADVSEPVKGQVAQWAKAYVNGDSAALLALTGDQDAKHRYVGLSGFKLPDTDQAVQILSAIKSGQGMLIVRGRVGMSRPVGDQQYMSYADFDLLMGDPSGAQPPVLAWGPAGSAAQLEPYSNALPVK